MSLGRRVGDQLRHPHGLAGRGLGHAMALVNERANRFTIARLDAGASDDVLELGFGPGRGLAQLARRSGSGRIVGIDQSAVMLAQAARRNARAVRAGRVHLVRGAFECLPFADASFDRVLAINVVYFWHRQHDILRELDRITRPDARIALYATDRRAMERWPVSRTGTHRLYDAAAMRALLADTGFPARRVEVWSFPAAFGVRGLCAIAGKGAG